MIGNGERNKVEPEYAIGRFCEDTRERLRIPEREYIAAADAKVQLMEAYFIEERFDVLLANYGEFEEEILRLALQHSLSFVGAPEGFPHQRRTLTRRVLNLLASCRYYHDQLKHSLSVMFGRDSELRKDVKSKQSSHYDSSFAYRMMEELRNVLQHRLDPIRSITANHQRTSMGTDFQLACTVTPQIEKATLLEDRRIRKRLGAELEGQAEWIDVKLLVREYVELVADGHTYIREQLKTHVEKWDGVIRALDDAYAEACSISAEDVPADLEICRLEPGKIPAISERVFLPNRVMELRRQLEHRNGQLKNLSRRYVTNQPASHIPSPDRLIA